MLPIGLAAVPAIALDKQSKKVAIGESRAKGTKVDMTNNPWPLPILTFSSIRFVKSSLRRLLVRALLNKS